MFPIPTISPVRFGLLVASGLGAAWVLGGCGGTQTTRTQVQETAEMKVATEDMPSLHDNNPIETGHPVATTKKTGSATTK